MAIKVEAVKKNYGRIEALRGLTLSVNDGEIYGLLGANGAGKTTLIKILTGITPYDSGTVRVLDMDPAQQSHAIRQQVGYMPQSAALYDDLTARQNVRFFAHARKIDGLERRIEEVLDFLNLSDRQDDPVHGFSGGMKQRVSLACALVHRPRLLLLDEPSTGVDPKLREALWQHFRDLADQGVTIVVSTHQMDEAFHCDRVAVMRDGMALACDTPRGLMARGRATVTIWYNGSTRTETLDNYAEQLPRMLEVQADRIEIHESTLEDVVLELIKEQSHV
jgi:ABC-2 type transport system ATP-binding protein